ncbi:MAG: hypothetical protein PVI70_05840 [Gammaproteobacteria bacterium]
MNPDRPDLSERQILLMDAIVIAAAAVILSSPDWPQPGSPRGQLAAALGALLLFTPLLFLVMKRSGISATPPTWFVAHVIATLAGSLLILVHAAGGDWISPPGLVLLLLAVLVLQGSLVRVVLARGFSLLFARNSLPTGFDVPAGLDKAELQRLIDAKTVLLQRIDSQADEALFSPALKHWLRHPLSSLRYQRLAEREARLVGARASAGISLAWARRIHMLVALLFYLGLLAHVVVVLFFAGYAAGGGTIDWWHITAWGG